MQPGDAVLILRKGKARFTGRLVSYEPHDGSIGNPESFCVVRVLGADYGFRKGARDHLWIGRSKTMRRMGYVEIRSGGG